MTAILFKPQSGKWILPGNHPQSLLHPTSGMKTILTWPSGLCGAFLQQLRQSQEPPATHGRKTPAAPAA
jgi:hypothetical protein